MLNRNVTLLAASQACYVMAMMTIVSFSGLAGQMLSPDPRIATLPMTCVLVATTLSIAPMSLLMQRTSRRFGFRFGLVFGVAGSCLAIYSLYISNFYLLCLSLFLIGPFQAAAQYYRFAAAESVEAQHVPKAISMVLIGGLVAAFMVPPLVSLLEGVFQDYTYFGAFVLVGLSCVISLLPLSFIKPVGKPVQAQDKTATKGRPLKAIIKTPKFIVAVTNGALGYAMMTFVMTASPLEMNACNFSTFTIAETIQWHSVAMFMPSLFTGILIARFGVLNVLFAGHLLYIVAFVVALEGNSLIHFYSALIALGLAWNFCHVSSSSLITQVHTEEEKGRVQGLNEFLVFSTNAVASLAAGIILSAYGWQVVNRVAFVMVAIAITVTLGWAVHQVRVRAFD